MMKFELPVCLLGLILWLGASSDARGQWYTQYQDLAAINARLDQFANDYPSLVETFTIGQSYEGRDIRGIKISGPGGDRAVRPGVLLNGTQHAREWISPMTNMFAAEQLLARYQVDEGIQSLVDDVDFYVIPVVNPDGYVYSWTTERQWRKNRRPVGLGVYGVDLNRNWDVGWGLNSGSSPFPNDLTYRGPSPFSEPETQALRDFYYDNQNLVSNIDFHSYSQLVLYPYGYSDTAEPADQALLQQLAIDMASSMQSVNGIFYDPISASELYLASGISIDWSYGDQSVYSYTIELRPNTFFPGFELPPQEILPTAEEAFAAVLDLGQFTLTLSSGDFNADSRYDCRDIDALSRAIVEGTNKYEFDIDGDGVIDPADVGAWLASAGAARWHRRIHFCRATRISTESSIRPISTSGMRISSQAVRDGVEATSMWMATSTRRTSTSGITSSSHRREAR